jgi:hypothetical protein
MPFDAHRFRPHCCGYGPFTRLPPLILIPNTCGYASAEARKAATGLAHTLPPNRLKFSNPRLAQFAPFAQPDRLLKRLPPTLDPHESADNLILQLDDSGVNTLYDG